MTEPIVAIVGAAAAPSQDTSALSPAALMAQAAAHAIADANLIRCDIDGVFSASSYYYMPTLTLAENLGIEPSYSDSTVIGGASFVAHVRHAAAAIASGMCSTAVIAHSSTQRTDGSRTVFSASESLPYEAVYGPLWPISGFAMIARRHMSLYGTTSEQLAEIAVAAREWAILNPDARTREPLTIDDVLFSPMIADPLHRHDCCLVTNGAGALVLTSPERAADLTDHPVFVTGAAETHVARNVSQLPDFVTSPAAVTAPAALRQAGCDLVDVDAFEIYDAFTISALQIIEDIGLCTKGEGGPFVAEGHLRPGGRIPLNTNGGGLSYRHPGMLGMTLLLEAVTQLRGRGAARQVPDARRVLVHALGGVQMSGATAILENQRDR